MYVLTPAPVKRCSQCRTIKSYEMFYKRAASHDGLKPLCIECEKARQDRYYRQNREARLEVQRRHYEAHRDDRLEYARERSQRPEVKERKNALRRGVGRTDRHRRRAREASAVTDQHTADDLRASWEERGLYGCRWCEAAPYEHSDHVIPISRGGAHTVGNLVPSCAPCNLSKNAKLPFVEWWPPN